MVNIQKISENDLEKINGGASISVGTSLIIAAAVVFINGIIEGITNPKRCQE